MEPGLEHLGAALGRSVKVALTCGAFQGVLHYVGSRCLFLHTVKNLETGRSTRGIKVFFRQEIVNVELLDEADSEKGTAVLSECTSAAERNKEADAAPGDGGPWSSPCTSLESQLGALNSLNLSSLSGKEEEEMVEYTVVDHLQQKFGSAVLHLKQQRIISVVGEGVNLCRHGKLSWLEIATKSRVFLFDIFLLGPQAFKNGLQMVLEDKNILKVIHDCRCISDCLFHQYSVLLVNVFDTQKFSKWIGLALSSDRRSKYMASLLEKAADVLEAALRINNTSLFAFAFVLAMCLQKTLQVADVLQFSMATGGFFPHRACTLQECLMQHLKIPSKWDALMKCRQRVALENPDIWFLRPSPASLLQVLALKAVYLLLLHSSLMDNLMSDLTAVVRDYLNISQNESGDHLESIKSTCTELPKELRQLADIQKLRRERAVKDYRMNEDGLLIRPVIEVNERNDPQKDETHRDDRDCLPPNKAVCQITSPNSQDLLHQGKKENQNKVSSL